MKKALVIGTALFTLGSVLGAGVAIAAQMNFSDVKTSDWFHADVQNVFDWGVVKGYPDGTYKPANFVNRAELAAMLSRLGGYLKQEKDQCYSKAEIDAMFKEAGLKVTPPTKTGTTSGNTNTNAGGNSNGNTLEAAGTLNANTSGTTPSETNSVYDVLASTPETSAYLAAVNRDPDLVAQLKDESKKFTIFAPTNSAAGISTVTSDADRVLLHITTKDVSESDIIIMHDATEFETLAGQSFMFQKNDAGEYTVNGKVMRFVEPTRFASNGIVLVFDTIIE